MRSEWLQRVSRVVVKLGTGILTDDRRLPDLAQMKQLVAQIAGQRKAGKAMVVVSSGAVGAGMGVLGYGRRPRELADLQACAAVGQTRLMGMYEDLFSEFGLHVGQVLLTHHDLAHRDLHLNARNTLVTLLDRGVAPIVNENDATSFTELKFGDNDRLSALAACLLPADLLVILTSTDGFYENYGKPDARLIPTVERIDTPLERLAGGTQSATSVGGMSSKLDAARIATRAGIPVVVASGRKPDVLARILEGLEEGTLFVPQSSRLKSRKRYIAFFPHPKGSLIVDEGAKRALREQGKSLLPQGVIGCQGEFGMGSVVSIRDDNHTEFARGIVNFDSRAIGDRVTPRTELIHRNNLVIL